ncbi:hypothetical protein [Streptomyces sp. WM6378]|uniref:hypothetical protein n=1 Tax=Streptomyces sp. WM6378 TaxID=1415557 RepID=UPI0006AF88BA|nr:hypothetical protein [Streptomyces sp. WM6378]KOU43576.1 hypothetical protein ADK54_17435 [Streptomyces sp. WM6378]
MVADGPDATAIAGDVTARLADWNTFWRSRGAHHLQVHAGRSGDTTPGTVIAERGHHILRAVWTPTSTSA